MMHLQKLPAKTPAIPSSPARHDEPADLNRHLLQLASDDKWLQIADVVARRNALLCKVPAPEREQALLAAQSCNEKLKMLARSAKTRCAEQLGALRQGKRVAESYRANR